MDEVIAAFREIHEVEGRVAELEDSLVKATRALNVLFYSLTPAEQEVALRELGMSQEEVAQAFKPKRRIGFMPGEDDAAPQSAEPHRTGKIGY
jgi:hypothetical protein